LLEKFMIKQINSYKELLEEKARLKTLLVEQELLIKEDWHSLKEELKPAMLVGATMRKFFTRKAGITAAQLGVNLLADGFVKKVLLSKTGWLIRWVIPFLIKNYASHVAGEPEKLIQKIKKFFSKNGKAHHETGMDAV
jgi:hypothetical protein